ncbi:MAG TPA: imidazolonepropionase [Candidatus Elarobacter sp.]|nr:imidazolonepropionase [Candidatus Elarobacter sp.]
MKIFVGASQVVTCSGAARARRGAEMRDAAILGAGHAVVTDGERIVAVGARDALERQYASAERVECAGRVLTPGLVDSHTHAVFGKPRFEEQELRAEGVAYMEIARRGGGIHSSVRDLRARSEDDLLALTRERVARLASYGATTIEIKSGYGLSTDAELTSLRVIARLQRETTLRIVPTFLGAHEIPLEYREREGGRREYVSLLTEEMIPCVVRDGLARFADVFCEPGVFTLDETRTILRAATARGLLAKLHADELEPLGGAELAAELGATSADHLAAISEHGIAALAASTTVATLLPGTMLFLGRATQAPARAMIAAGAAVALATDFNPGTSPTPSLPLMMTLGVSQLRMSVAEVLIATTVNGAAALALADVTGQLAPGFAADLALWDCEDVREIPYWYGDRRCVATWTRGEPTRVADHVIAAA